MAAVDGLAAATSTVDVEDGPASDLEAATEEETSKDLDDLDVTAVDPVSPDETSFSSICDLDDDSAPYCALWPPTSMPSPPLPPAPPPCGVCCVGSALDCL